MRIGTLQGGLTRFAMLRERLVQRLQALGLWPIPPHAFQSLEGAMQSALPQVRASTSFREGLRENLALAAERKTSGLVIEYQRSFRRLIVLGLSVGVVAAVVTTLVVVFRGRWAKEARC